MATLPTTNRRLRIRADDSLQHHAVRAKPQHTVSEKQSQQPRAFTASPELPVAWSPFRSSLFDTVRVVVKVKHTSLDRVAELVPDMTRDGFVHLVRSPLADAKAQVISRKHCEELLLEFSIPKFLTGQNIVGIEDLHDGCKQGIRAVLALMGIKPTRDEIHAIRDGKYRLTRVDFVAHVDCGTRERAAAMMIAVRDLVVGKGKDISMYETDAVYVGQHSRRRSLKAYNKGVELAKHPMPAYVYGSKYLTERANGLVRLELVMRREFLTDLGLDAPLAWTPEIAHGLMQEWMHRLSFVKGVVADISHIDQLTPTLQLKTRAWMLGDKLAFSRGVGRETYRAGRKRVLNLTGIDVDSHLTPAQQAQVILTARQMFERGFGLRDHAERWDRLKAAVAKNERQH